jgi:peptidoglycan/xylan/chitin deacetylase (PgdA/CDA1 family)
MAHQSSRRVSVLLTGDVDYSRHHHERGKRQAFEHMLQIGRELGGAVTFFFVAREAEQVPDLPRLVRQAGHEVGCHGLTHGEEEEYDKMPVGMQQDYLRKATDTLRSLSGAPVGSFRGPRVKVSGTTLSLLSDMGYLADSTVCSQRFDLVSSNLLHPGWLRAPRLPYHPNREDAYRRGDLPILEVPVSALAIPFISSTLYVFGAGFMKMLFRTLYLEARRTGKPIVYLFHPYEFTDEIEGARDYSGNLKVHGLRLRRHLYRGNAQRKLAWNMELWRFMADFDGVRFSSVSEYARMRAEQEIVGASTRTPR